MMTEMMTASLWLDACVAALGLFLLLVCASAFRRPAIFTKRFARKHRICGLALLCWLVLGVLGMVDAAHFGIWESHMLYDVVLGLLGIATTLSAAHDFRAAHATARIEGKGQEASGTLSEHKTVTVSEMLEHAFYQCLNLVQILYIRTAHSISSQPTWARLAVALLATAPWIARGRFPLNRFSDNWNKSSSDTGVVKLLYATKKWQYVFYKHFLLHGLNLSLAVNSALAGAGLAEERFFRLYWLCLNTSYVMEFFLQSLVKARLLTQTQMLALQQLLMLASSVAAVRVLESVRPMLAISSLALNFSRKGHEIMRVMTVALVAGLWWA